MRSTDGKLLVTIIVNVDGIALDIDVGTNMGSLDWFFDDYKYNKLEGLLLVYLLGYTDDKVCGYNEGIEMVSTDVKVLGTLLWDVDEITLEVDVGTDMGFLDGSFDGSNDINLEVL